MVDTEGNSFPMSIVQAVSATSVKTPASSFAQGGSTKIADKRRIALRPWLQDILDVIRADDGMTIQMLGKRMRTKPGFMDALKAQRATVAQTIQLFPEIRTEKRGNIVTVFLQPAFGG